MVCMNERQREEGVGGGWVVVGGEEREQVLTRTDQEYSTDLEDESGGRRGLLTDKLH